jgi:hypothetical protein
MLHIRSVCLKSFLAFSLFFVVSRWGPRIKAASKASTMPFPLWAGLLALLPIGPCTLPRLPTTTTKTSIQMIREVACFGGSLRGWRLSLAFSCSIVFSTLGAPDSRVKLQFDTKRHRERSGAAVVCPFHYWLLFWNLIPF